MGEWSVLVEVLRGQGGWIGVGGEGENDKRGIGWDEEGGLDGLG